MKKTYINPELKTVVLATRQMLASSNPEGGFNQGAATELTEEIGSGNMSRQFDYDYDDEEE